MEQTMVEQLHNYQSSEACRGMINHCYQSGVTAYEVYRPGPGAENDEE